MTRPSARLPDMGAPLNLGAMSNPVSTKQITDEELQRMAQTVPTADAPARTELPPIIDPGNVTEFDADMPAPTNERSLYSMTDEEMEAELTARDAKAKSDSLRQRLAAARAVDRNRIETRAAVPDEDPLRDDPHTWILAPENPAEYDVCDAWVDAHCPVKKQQNAFSSVVDLAQLRPDEAVMCLVRGHGIRRRLTLMKQEADDEKQIHSSVRDPEELFAQMVLSKPVYVRDHWRDSAAQGFARAGGSLNVATFMEAIGKVCTPFSPTCMDKNQCKQGQNPRLLVLREP